MRKTTFSQLKRGDTFTTSDTDAFCYVVCEIFLDIGTVFVGVNMSTNKGIQFAPFQTVYANG